MPEPRALRITALALWPPTPIRPGEGNLISGNFGTGVSFPDSVDTGNTVAGNYIGTDVTGTLAIPNGGGGVYVAGPTNTIGGTTAAARNVISGNNGFGVQISGTSATGNTVDGNYIGISAPIATGTIE